MRGILFEAPTVSSVIRYPLSVMRATTDHGSRITDNATGRLRRLVRISRARMSRERGWWMVYTNDDVARLAKRRSCPRCDLNKTLGNALCRVCRSKLPPNMRTGLESVSDKDWMSVGRALR